MGADENNLGIAYRERIRGDRADNIEQAIKACELALTVRTREDFPEYWAQSQHNLADAYQDRIRGERADNIEQAIKAHEAALTVFTRDSFPWDWALTQKISRAHTITASGASAPTTSSGPSEPEAALTVRTRDAFPWDWAETKTISGSPIVTAYEGERRQYRTGHQGLRGSPHGLHPRRLPP